MNRPARHAAGFVSTLLLAVVLVLAQWIGLQHRIAHGLSVQIQTNGAFSSPFKSSGKSDANHSCALFDAAAAGDLLTLPPCPTPLLAGARYFHAAAAWSSWNAQRQFHYSSRAPPHHA